MGRWGNTGHVLADYSEADLEQALAANLHLLQDGLELIGRQVNIGVGIVDILAKDATGGLVVIEVKRHVIDCEAVGQLLRYMAAIDEVLLRLAWKRVLDTTDDKGLQQELWRKICQSESAVLYLTGYLTAPEIRPTAEVLIDIIDQHHPRWSIAYCPIKLLSVPSVEEPAWKPHFSEGDLRSLAEKLEHFVPTLDDLLGAEGKEGDADDVRPDDEGAE